MKFELAHPKVQDGDQPVKVSMNIDCDGDIAIYANEYPLLWIKTDGSINLAFIENGAHKLGFIRDDDLKIVVH